MKINYLFLAISTCLTLLPMHANAQDRDAPVHGEKERETLGLSLQTRQSVRSTLEISEPKIKRQDVKVDEGDSTSTQLAPSPLSLGSTVGAHTTTADVHIGHRDPFVLQGLKGKAPVNLDAPIAMKTGLDTPMATLQKTESEYKRDFSQVVKQLNGIPQAKYEDLSKRSMEIRHLVGVREARRFVEQEIINFVPAELLTEIDFKPSDDPMTLSQKKFRLGLKIIDYSNLMPAYLLSMIHDNRDLIAENKESNPEAIKSFVNGLKIGDTPLPQGIKELMTGFIYHPNPTPLTLMNLVKYYKNKYVGIQFIQSAKLVVDNIQTVAPESQADALFSAALTYKWVGDRLGANWEKANGPAENASSQPFYYQYYQKSLDLHKLALNRIEFAEQKFKEKYWSACLTEALRPFITGIPVTESAKFLVNPLSVMPKGLKV